jgi:hypothetical protein
MARKSIRYMLLSMCIGVLESLTGWLNTLHNPKERSDFGLGSVDDDDEEEEWFL